MTTLDMNKINKLRLESIKINQAFKEKTKELKEIEDQLEAKNKEIQNLITKGYWWTCDIDDYWKKPKKYSIKSVYCNESGKIYLTIKEVFKKKPWPSFTGEHSYELERFLKEVNVSKTEQEASDKYYNRICPKCGGIMKYSHTSWCTACMTERKRVADEFEKNHVFYYPETDTIYEIQYTDELTREKGFYGHHFTIRRLDTGEIIHTDNLWSGGAFGRKVDYPVIEFIEGYNDYM